MPAGKDEVEAGEAAVLSASGVVGMFFGNAG